MNEEDEEVGQPMNDPELPGVSEAISGSPSQKLFTEQVALYAQADVAEDPEQKKKTTKAILIVAAIALVVVCGAFAAKKMSDKKGGYV